MKALSVIGGAAVSGALVAPHLPAVVLAAVLALLGLTLVWRLTDSPLEVARHPQATWFDGSHTSPVVVRGAVRAGERTGRR